jgi:hypothetical protein
MVKAEAATVNVCSHGVPGGRNRLNHPLVDLGVEST